MSTEPSRPLRVRFAPSPTGTLHLGNARTALFNWIVARQSGGRFILRIEDTDIDRQQADSEQGILTDLRWLGLEWDEGPEAGGDLGPYRQSERAAFYESAAARLLENGRAYRCFCDERELEAERARRVAERRAPHYSGRCRALSAEESAAHADAGEPFAIRFAVHPPAVAVPEATVEFVDRLRGHVTFPLKELGDTVIVRRDGRPTYNFAVVVDDAAMEIDLVLRGDDHLSNTPRQVLLFRALDYRTPEFAHLPTVRGADGGRLSKRHGAVSVAEYRRRGYPVEGLINALALLGWSPGEDRTLIDREELLREFELARVSRSPATFDQAKLEWICSQHIRSMPAERLAGPVVETLIGAGLLPEPTPPGTDAWGLRLAEMLRNSISHLEQVPGRCAGLFFAGGRPEQDEAREVLTDPGAVEVVRSLVREMANRTPADAEGWHEVRDAVRRATGLKGKALLRPLRVVITGQTRGPELDLLVPLAHTGHALFPERIASLDDRARRTAEWIAAG